MSEKQDEKSYTSTSEATIRMMFGMIVIGASLAAYAHQSFATKFQVKEIKSDIQRELTEIKRYSKNLDDKMDDVIKFYYLNKGRDHEQSKR